MALAQPVICVCVKMIKILYYLGNVKVKKALKIQQKKAKKEARRADR